MRTAGATSTQQGSSYNRECGGAAGRRHQPARRGTARQPLPAPLHYLRFVFLTGDGSARESISFEMAVRAPVSLIL